MSDEFELFLNSCPDVGKAYLELFKSVMKSPALDKKTRQLLLIGVMTAQNYPDGVRAHVPQALRAGATREEILDAVVSTIPVAGINGVLGCLPVAVELTGGKPGGA
jgi:AhpD family alkylhydroperoxidase